MKKLNKLIYLIFFIVISIPFTSYSQSKFNLINTAQFHPKDFLDLNQLNSSGSWSNDFTVPGLIRGIVYTMASDGNDLYIGGEFTTAGSEIAYNIVKWDGSNWNSIGEGLENGVNGSVYGLTVIDGKLFVGGNFTKAGSLNVNGIAYWSDGNWHTLGQDSVNGVRSAQTTLTGEIIVTPGNVYTLNNYNDQVVFGGFFNIIGSDTAFGIGGWNVNTEQWETFDSGLSNLSPEDPTYAYSIIQKDNDLYVGGKFIKAGDVNARGFAKWNGNQWSEVGNGVNGWIRDMVLDQEGNIYVVGMFDTVGNIYSSGIAKWDGSIWQSVGGGIQPFAGALIPDVRSVEIVNSNLFVTGAFTIAGSSTVSSVAKWNGNTWSSLGTGIVISQIPFPGTGTILQKINSDLYIGGFFTEADNRLISNIIRWDTQNNTYNTLSDGSLDLGVYDGHLFSVALNDQKVYAAGNFSIIGGVKAKNIALFEQGIWKPLYSGVDGEIYTVCINSNEVYVGGTFGQAGSTTAFHIAKWDGNVWSSVGFGVGGVANPSVNVIKQKENYLYVGGHFAIVGDSINFNLTANSIARFNLLNNTWENLCSGVELFPGTPGFVNDIEFIGDSIIVGGQFSSAGNISANSLATFSNDNWSVVGNETDNGVNGIIYSLKKIDGEIYIGGEFERPGTGNTISLVKWNGSNWTEINGGIYYQNTLGQYPAVTDIEFNKGNLLVCGLFNKAGSIDVNNIALYNGVNWDNMGGGTNYLPLDIEIDSKRVILGGTFTIAGGFPSSAFSVYNLITSVNDDNIVDQNEYFLSQNYPNPFNPITRISWQSTVGSFTTLKIFDMLGSEVATLINEYRNAGNHEVEFNASYLPSGVYFYNITSGDFRSTKKMLLIK